MLKRILCLVLALALLAGPYPSPAEAGKLPEAVLADLLKAGSLDRTITVDGFRGLEFSRRFLTGKDIKRGSENYLDSHPAHGTT